MDNNRGNTLVEAVVSLAILCVVIVMVFTLCGLIIRGAKSSENQLNEAVQLNSIFDEIRTAVKANPDKSDVSMRATIASVVSQYPNWRYTADIENNGMVMIRLTAHQLEGERIYEGKVYSGATY